MVESLWSIPAAENIRAPLTIMKEQATALTQQTKGSLVGSVETVTQGVAGLAISLSIQVPSLNDYTYRLLTYTQPITMYPGRLIFALKPQFIEVEDEHEFLEALKDLLSSEEVKRVLTSLLVQANAA